MNAAELLEYCVGLKHAYVETPFGNDTLVGKVAGKVFALIPLDEVRPQISLKADPEDVIMFLDSYEDATRAPYMSKKHWVRLYCDGNIPTAVICTAISTSYKIVYAGLTKAVRVQLEAL